MRYEYASQATKKRKSRYSKSTFSVDSDQEVEFFQSPHNPITKKLLYFQQNIGNQAVRRQVIHPSVSPATIHRDAPAVVQPQTNAKTEQKPTGLEQYEGYVRQLIELGVIDQADFQKFDERVHSQETAQGLEKLVAARKGKDFPAAERDFRNVLNQDIAPKVNAKFEQVSKSTQTAVDRSFPELNDPLQKRIQFLIVLPKYFSGKTVDEVINHFKDVNPVTVPGMPAEFILHKTVNDRLVMVATRMEELGMPMPKTDVGFGLRGFFNPEDLQGWGFMVHALGIAIDFRAASNANYKDPIKQTLRNTLLGGEARFDLPTPKKIKADPKSYAYGYLLTIKKMGAEMAANGQLDEETAKEAETFFQKFDSEYTRLNAGSRQLVEQSKQSGITDKLQEGRTLLDRRAVLQKEIAGLQKKVKDLEKFEGKTIDATTSKSDSVKIQQLKDTADSLQKDSSELVSVNLKIEQIKANLPITFADWLKKIDTPAGEIEKKLPDFAKIPAMKDIIEGEENIGKYQESRAKLAKDINDLHLTKFTLKVGKLNPSEFKSEIARVKTTIQTIQKLIEHQQYLESAGLLAPALKNEEQALQGFEQATKGSPDKDTAETKLNESRKARQVIATQAAGLNNTEKQALVKDQLSKNQLHSFQAKYATLLSKETFDPARLKVMQTRLTSGQQLNDELEKERKEYTRAIGGYSAAEAGKNSSKPEAKAAYAAKEEYVRYRHLKELHNRLMNDETFVFGKSSKFVSEDPSVWQFAKLGFFRTDEEPAGRTSMTSEDWQKFIKQPAGTKTGPKAKIPDPTYSEGFNQNFMRLMALYGFDQGVSWHGYQDSMHFELIEMKEKIAKP